MEIAIAQHTEIIDLLVASDIDGAANALDKKPRVLADFAADRAEEAA